MSMNNNDNSDVIASAIDSAGFDIMNDPWIPTQIVNPVTPSIPSVQNSTLNTILESTTKEFDVTIVDFPSFLCSHERWHS